MKNRAASSDYSTDNLAKLGCPSNESGQATIEFALVIIFLMSVVLFFIQLSLVFGWANYAQYATYMAARAYVSAGPTVDDQFERAREVMTRMVTKGGVDRAPSLAKGYGGGNGGPGVTIGEGSPFSKEDFGLSWREGVRYTFRSKIFLLPMGGDSLSGNDRFLTLTSETWLGREPSDDECKGVMSGKGIYDNGC